MTFNTLVMLKLERDTWKDMEKLSRAYREKKLHSYAVSKVKELGSAMVELGKDELAGYEEEDKESQDGEESEM